MPNEADAAAYPHAAQVISVTREVAHKASGKVEQGCRYFATSLRPHEAGPWFVRGLWLTKKIQVNLASQCVLALIGRVF